MRRTYTSSPSSIERWGRYIEGATDRQQRISGFDQAVYSRSTVDLNGAGGLGSHIAAMLCRKGIGTLVIRDHDVVEASNLNRQRFYPCDLGQNKALALVEHLRHESIQPTRLIGQAVRFEEAAEEGITVDCDVAICAVDNNPARSAMSRYYRERGIPVVFLAVSADADHGYVFVQDKDGPCLGCLLPDSVNDETYPCPGTPAISDILHLTGAMAVYAVDTCLVPRRLTWSYRRICLADAAWDSAQRIAVRPDCPLSANHLPLSLLQSP